MLPDWGATTTDSACKKGWPRTVSFISRSHRGAELTSASRGLILEPAFLLLCAHRENAQQDKTKTRAIFFLIKYSLLNGS
jgi:hypothetical protein